jgi:uncharacterized glyoxalase superfamily protein PhnB
MTENRSVPTNVMPGNLAYASVEEAVEWLRRAFGFSEHFRYGDPAHSSGAQMHLGDAWIMISKSREGWKSPAEAGAGTQSLTIFLEDVQGIYQRAEAAGAKILEEPRETEYGEFQWAALDFAGQHWLFAGQAINKRPEGLGERKQPRALRVLARER